MSPFRSRKQLLWLKNNKPKIYVKWKKKYGTKIDHSKKKKREKVENKKGSLLWKDE